MLSYVALAISGLCIAYAVHTYRCFNANLAAAKQSGIPYICTFDTYLVNPPCRNDGGEPPTTWPRDITACNG